MNVSLKNIDATKGIVKLEIVKADYADKVEKSLRSFRQKAEMPGFRKGMVPMGMVKKMYGSMCWSKKSTNWFLKTCTTISVKTN